MLKGQHCMHRQKAKKLKNISNTPVHTVLMHIIVSFSFYLILPLVDNGVTFHTLYESPILPQVDPPLRIEIKYLPKNYIKDLWWSSKNYLEKMRQVGGQQCVYDRLNDMLRYSQKCLLEGGRVGGQKRANFGRLQEVPKLEILGDFQR